MLLLPSKRSASQPNLFVDTMKVEIRSQLELEQPEFDFYEEVDAVICLDIEFVKRNI